MMVVSQGAQWLTAEVYQRLLRNQWREIKEIKEIKVQTKGQLHVSGS